MRQEVGGILLAQPQFAHCDSAVARTVHRRVSSEAIVSSASMALLLLPPKWLIDQIRCLGRPSWRRPSRCVCAVLRGCGDEEIGRLHKAAIAQRPAMAGG
jgi:hypothetical protein